MKDDIDTLVGEKTRLKGDLRFKGGLHVDGEVDGNIIAEGGKEEGVVIVSDRGTVKGTIKAPRVIINGTVDGDIDCSERLELQEKARIGGNIIYRSIEMKLGAQVTGQLALGGEATRIGGEAGSKAAGA